MRGGAIPLLAWGTLLAVLMAGNWVWTGDAIQVGTFAFAVLVIIGSGVALAVRSRSALRRGPPPPEPAGRVQAVPALSAGAALAGVALAMIVFGLAFGHFLIYFGAGVLLLALGRVAQEIRSARRSERDWEEGHRPRARVRSEAPR